MMAPRQSVAVHRKRCFRLSDSPVKMEAPIRRFFQLIFQSTMEDKRLRLPLKFAKKHGKELSETAKLTVCKGRVWEVGVKRGSKHIWFDNGWHEFAEYHSICHGHWLMFKYKGMSSFRVYIFNNSTCEIPYLWNKPRNDREDSLSSDQECRMEVNDPVDISSSAAYPNTSRKNFSLLLQNLHESSGSVRINRREGKSCNVEEHEDFVAHLSSLSPCSVRNSMKRNPHLSKGASTSHAADQAARESAVQVSTMEHENSADVMKSFSPDGEIQQKQPKERGRKKLQVDPDQQLTTQREDEVDMRFAFCESASARKRTATAEERERARNAAKAFVSTNPFCMVVLRPSNLNRGCIMYLPSCFAKQHLSRASGFIKLQVSDGKECLVLCIYRGGRAKLSQGWHEFTLENNLGEGDICFFELIKSRDIVLKVTVFRVLRGVEDIDLDKENHQDENDSAGAKQEREKSSRRKTFDYVYKRKGKMCKVKEEVEIIDVELINLEEKDSLGSEQEKEESANKKRFEFEHKRKSKNSKIKEEPELIDIDENGLLGTQQEREIIVTEDFANGLLNLSPESKRAVTSAIMYKPQNHAFMVIIKPDPNGTILHVPAAFANMHRRKISDPIRVQISDGKQWQSNWFIRPRWINHRSLILKEGWADFSFDNHLMVGDVCIFELILNSETFTLKAIIFHACLD